MALLPMISLPKPPHGAPCNSCGLCCLTETCGIGQALFSQKEGPCPALQPAGRGVWECGLIANPIAYSFVRVLEHGADKMAGAAAFLLGAGHGCDAVFSDDEPINVEFEESLAPDSMVEMLLGLAAMTLWGMKP